MLFTMILNLLVTRYVLRYLGAEDYGTYSAVGGVITLFAIFNAGISKANQRFITYELGSKTGHPFKTFNTIVNLTFIVAIISIVIIEILGLWFLYNKMNIPEERMNAAFWIFQFSIITMAITLISNPYNALIIAHEKMGVFASITILQVVLTFIMAWCLRYVTMDRLIYYGLMIMSIQLMIRLIYQIYCRCHFKEAKYRFYMNRKQVKELAKFTGWTTLSGFLGTIIDQGITILFNIFFGVIINAVYNITGQVRNAVLSFAQNVQRAMDPQITKSYASGDIKRHHTLLFTGSKLEVFMIYFILIPFFVKTDFILKLWLGNNLPPYLITFCRLAVVMSLVCSAFEVMRTSVMATGNLRDYVLYPNLIHLLLLPVCYLSNKYYHSPVMMMVMITVFYIIVYGARFYIAAKVSRFSWYEYVVKVVLRCLFVGGIGLLTVYGFNQLFPNNIWGFLFLMCISSISLIIYIYLMGLSTHERNLFNELCLKGYKMLFRIEK